MLTENQQKALKRIEKLEKIDKDPKGQLLELADLTTEHIDKNEQEHLELSEKIDNVSRETNTRIDEVEQAIEDIELLEPEKGEKGDKGDKGDKGKDGIDGKDGRDGIDGLNGTDGIDGLDGKDGEKGDKGDIPKHLWKGTSLAFENPDGTFGPLVNLQGIPGEIRTIVNGSSLKIQDSGVNVINSASTLNFGDNLSVIKSGETITINASSSGGSWGDITGTLSDQTDLQEALDLKADVSSLSSYLLKPSISLKTASYTATGAEDNNTVFVFSSFAAGSSLVLDPALFPDGTVLAVVHKGVDGEVLYVDAGTGKLMNGGQTYDLNHSGNAIIVVKKSDTAWEILSEASPDYSKVYGLSSYVDSTVENLIPVYGMVGYNNLSELTDTSTARTNLGLGTMAVQNANSVAISAGTIYGLTRLGLTSTALSTSTIGNIEFYGDDYYANITTPINGSQYPPAYSSTYVRATSRFSLTYGEWKAFNPSLSLTGGLENGWVSGNTQVTNQVINIDLGQKKVIDKIYFENGHNSGASTNAGAKNFTVWGTNDATAFADTTYAVDTNWVQVTSSLTQLAQHVASNVSDPQYTTLTNTTGYRYYRIKFADNWGGTSYIMVRRIELQANNNYRKNLVMTDGATLTSTKLPMSTTNGRLIDSPFYGNNTGIGNITSPSYPIDISGNIRVGSAVYLNHENVGAGLNTAIYVYGSGAYRSALAYDGTTGKIVYQGIGGTQGVELQTLNRNVRVSHLTSDSTHGLTFNTTDITSAAQNHFQVATRFNGTGTYDAENVLLKDDASNAESNFKRFFLWNGASYDTKWRLKKDGTQTNTAGHIEKTTRITTSPYTVLSTDYIIYVDTDGGAITVNLPAGVEGTTYKIINVGSSGNSATVAPNGSETVRGGATLVLTDGQQAYITYNATEKWW